MDLSLPFTEAVQGDGYNAVLAHVTFKDDWKAYSYWGGPIKFLVVLQELIQ